MPDISREFFQPLYQGLKSLVDIPEADRPTHLAHYTSMDTLEKILRHKQLWMSHPFFMNDHQEMVFGLSTAFGIVNDEANNGIFATHVSTEMVGRFRFFLISSSVRRRRFIF